MINWFIRRHKVVTSGALAGTWWGQKCTLQSNVKRKQVRFQPRFEGHQRVAAVDDELRYIVSFRQTETNIGKYIVFVNWNHTDSKPKRHGAARSIKEYFSAPKLICGHQQQVFLTTGLMSRHPDFSVRTRWAPPTANRLAFEHGVPLGFAFNVLYATRFYACYADAVIRDSACRTQCPSHFRVPVSTRHQLDLRPWQAFSLRELPPPIRTKQMVHIGVRFPLLCRCIILTSNQVEQNQKVKITAT